MAAAEVQPLVVNPANLHNIESFFNDSAYREAIENSANFNTRLCVERRLRMPFLDPQTGVAQNHCSLFMSKHQRMPGAREGQIYTYPAARWRKARRQYLSYHRSGRWAANSWSAGFGLGGPDGMDGPGVEVTGDGTSLDAHDTDSKDSHQRDAQIKDDPKEWMYDDMGMEELDAYDEPEPESDEDYCDENYSSRRKRGGGGGGRSGGAGGAGSGAKGKRSSRGGGNDSSRSGGANDASDSPVPKRGRGAGRGRKKAPQAALPYEVPGDADKPYGCECKLCGARYKTRPGLNYHYTHSHKEAGGSAGSDGDSRDSPARPVIPPGVVPPPLDPAAAAAAQPIEYQDSPPRRVRPPGTPAEMADENSASGLPSSPAPTSPPPRVDDETSRSSEVPLSPSASRLPPGAVKPPPSPYCDFCLGDQRENKKTGVPEELVSCSDCGRSGESHRRNDANNKHTKNNVSEIRADRNDNTLAVVYNGTNGYAHLGNVEYKTYSEDEFEMFAKSLTGEVDGADRPHSYLADNDSPDRYPVADSPPAKPVDSEITSVRKSSRKVYRIPIIHKRPYRKKCNLVNP
ncbi:double PHD fingers d4 isoform X2 [Arctopsyche grandis]|uniref:double PHD fingers d4 isoform X2 n=1 Tax=Arctopsyche grandis TaxID=121162 RepID=UPI00406D8A25